MNTEQRRFYHGKLWPAACRVQGWNSKDEHQRKRVTFSATGEESTSSLDQDQVTLLFNKLKWLADPTNFDKALADSDPAAALAENKRKKVIWRIEQVAAKAGLTEAWLIEASAAKCQAQKVLEWRKLPTVDLLKLSMTVETRSSEAAKERRASKKRPAQLMQDLCTGPF